MYHPRSRRVAATLVVGALATMACGDDDDAVATTTTTTASADDGPAVVEVTAVDYAYQGLPDELTAGDRLTLVNDSTGEVHELVAFRLPDAETRSIDELASLPADELLPALGGEPATVLVAAPGGEVIPAVGDGTLSDPGRYAVICVIPTGADPAEYLEKAATSDGPPDVAGGPPHITMGMYAELTVR